MASLDLLYLSAGDIEGLAVEPARLADAIGESFRARARGAALLPAKCGLRPASGGFFHAMPAAIEGGHAGLKWIGGAPDNHARGLPHIMGLMILSELASGRPIALLEGGVLTGLRTAALSLLAARFLARPDSACVAFVGCGLQARTHLRALSAELPIRAVRALSRSRESAERFALEARELGYRATVCADPAELMAGADIVVTTVPAAPGLRPFLDARALAAGSFASLVDLGRSWTVDGLSGFDRAFTDDLEQTRALADHSPTLAALDFAGDLAALLGGTVEGRTERGERLAFAFPGCALADVAAAAHIVERAQEAGVGRRLPL